MTFAPVLDRIAADLVAVLRGASGVSGRSPALPALSDVDLLAGLAAVERVGRVVDAARVAFAGDVGARSRPELGDEGLSRGQNFTSPGKLLSAVTGSTVHEAQARLTLGSLLRGPVLLGGASGPVPFPAVSEALSSGTLAVEAAGVITRHCADLAERGLAPEVVADAEQTLVEQTLTGHLTADQTGKLAIHLRELLDPDGAEPRAEAQQTQRSLTFSPSSPDGMLRGRFALTPEQAGIWVGSIQALQSPRLTGPRFQGEEQAVTEAALADPRTQAQRNVDTITELITRAAAAPDMPHLSGSATTVNVHVTLTDLQEGRGVGWIDGITEPVPTSTIAQLRCHAMTVTTLFGDAGEVLHHGKTRRLFSPAQNRALAARDGGCVWQGCDRPPSWCETHHVEEWVSADRLPGRTDIDNGVLLCHFHHSHLHKTAWTLALPNGVPHLVPPRWIDPAQTPIPTTQRRTHPSTTPARAPAREPQHPTRQ